MTQTMTQTATAGAPAKTMVDITDVNAACGPEIREAALNAGLTQIEELGWNGEQGDATIAPAGAGETMMKLTVYVTVPVLIEGRAGSLADFERAELGAIERIQERACSGCGEDFHQGEDCNGIQFRSAYVDDSQQSIFVTD